MNELFVAHFAGIAFFAIGLGVSAKLLTGENGALTKAWNGYLEILKREIRFLHLPLTAERIGTQQLVFCAGWLLLVTFSGVYILLLLLPILAFTPRLVLAKRHADRVTRIETQLDGWLISLANSLKSSPSLGEALSSTATLMYPPISQELENAVKENQLGVPLDEAIRNMGQRIGSTTFSTALIALLIGRQSGGELPQILEQTAATLREMARLEGIVRTKTAEGKAQAYVLAAIPLVLVVAIHWIHPTLMLPLINTTSGNVMLGIAVLLWLGSIPVALKILAVDI